MGQRRGVGPAFGEDRPVELGVGGLAAGRAAPRERGVDVGDLELEPGQGGLGAGHGVAQPGLGLVMGAFEPVEGGVSTEAGS